MLLTTAVALDSNVLAGENKSMSDAGGEVNTSSLLFRMFVLGIPAFCVRILGWGSFDFCLGIKATKESRSFVEIFIRRIVLWYTLTGDKRDGHSSDALSDQVSNDITPMHYLTKFRT